MSGQFQDDQLTFLINENSRCERTAYVELPDCLTYCDVSNTLSISELKMWNYIYDDLHPFITCPVYDLSFKYQI